MGIYEEIGVRRVINASYCQTVLGGSTLSKETMEAAHEANRCFVEMGELCEKAGEIIAGITGAEAARITAGAFCGLVLSAAACIAGKDPDKMRRLPDTTGMKNEVIIQRNLRIRFDRAMEVAGGKFIEVEPTLEAMEAAITEKTAAIYYFPRMDPPRTDIVPLEEVIDLGHRHAVPIIVDAAGQTYPTDRVRMFVRMGADLVCYSGKYFSGPNSTGFVCGRKDLVEAVVENSFIGPDIGWVGRGYKLDRQEIIALVVALQRWMKMDHEKERLQPAGERRDRLMEALKAIPDVKLVPLPYAYHVFGLQITLEKKTPKETDELAKRLREGDPSIHIRGASENNLIINTLFLADGEEHILAQRLKSLITDGGL
ncbi:aminotransferase class V-fold PLP-dependent enzyme [Chloroflexota bacterium]